MKKRITNQSGFTLVELLATIVILAIVAGVAVSSGIFSLGEAKGKTEEIFIETIKDAMDIYLVSDAKTLDFNEICTFTKSPTRDVKLYKASDITFNTIINSTYKPITAKDLVNPNNKQTCNASASISIYRDTDYVYYYRINKTGLGCLITSGYIDNLPVGLPEGCY